MANPKSETGFAPVNGAQIHFEVAGDGPAFVMIHAGVADSRQWNNEFPYFSARYRLLRYDMRGYGKSEPVAGDFRHIDDLTALLDALKFSEPLVLMGCSMGGGLAMDFTLAHPDRVRALIMVGSGPSGLELDVPRSPKFAEAEKAWEAGDMDRVAEIETQIWFDGEGRTPEQVDQAMRKLAFEMDRIALTHEKAELGKRLADAETPAAKRLAELKIPILIVVGEHDTPYILAAADHMAQQIAGARKVVVKDAAHLPNMDHPGEFRKIVEDFLDSLDV